jgi:hypothetical protein
MEHVESLKLFLHERFSNIPTVQSMKDEAQISIYLQPHKWNFSSFIELLNISLLWLAEKPEKIFYNSKKITENEIKISWIIKM